MTNQLDLRDLRYFEAIAEAGHLGKAASKLHRSQPALTGCVRRLEATLGTALFERVGRGIRLTAAGEALARRARRPEIVADAARAILLREARTCTGNFFLDEEVLRAEGVTDLSRYAVAPGSELAPDLFVDPA